MNCLNIGKAVNLDAFYLRQVVRQALREDIGRRDITTELVIPNSLSAKAVLLAKEDCVICGLRLVSRAFYETDRNIKFHPLVKDGQLVKKGAIIARIQGRARSILTAERVALNFLCWLSGIATQTRIYLKKIKPYKTKIADTRKTIPGLRLLQKYAVRTGGGCNHRMGLDELVLIKDNHIGLMRSQNREAASPKNISDIRKKIPKNTKIEIEVGNLREFRQALEAAPDIIMLDNMSARNVIKAATIRSCVYPKAARFRPLLEVSGGIALKNIRQFAAAGADIISVGSLTHSSKSVDISLEVV